MNGMTSKTDLDMVWDNIEYYRKSMGMLKTDVYRPERFGKGIGLKGLFEIAQTLNIPVNLLFETEEGREITRDVAWDIVCAELKITRSDIIKAKRLIAKIEKSLKEYRGNG